MSRASWNSYFMQLAIAAASRATCDRKHVGCVLVFDKSVIATGYNGSVRGMDHCDDVGHEIVNDHCVRTVHAEANAIAQAARRGARTDQAWAYVTAMPCWNCFQLLANAGIVRIVFGGEYRAQSDYKVREAARQIGIQVIQHPAAP